VFYIDQVGALTEEAIRSYLYDLRTFFPFQLFPAFAFKISKPIHFLRFTGADRRRDLLLRFSGENSFLLDPMAVPFAELGFPY
jgi:hypothetical protein